MNIHEHQAKEILKKFRIPVPNGVVIFDLKDINSKIKKLSAIIKSQKIKKIDLAKIDTEGHEFEVLKGMGQSIKNIKYILIEFHNDEIYLSYNPRKIHNHLVKNDFALKTAFKFPFTTWEDRFYFNNKFK